MRILITGAFGNIGFGTLLKLLDRGHEVISFDLPTKSNLKKFRKLQKELTRQETTIEQLKPIWGDILENQELDEVLRTVDVVIHLAAIIPNLSEINKELATKVNVRGTERILNALKSSQLNPKIIYVSTVTVHGPTMHLEPPLTADMPYNPKNHYASTKVETEKLIKASGLNYVILRFTASLHPDFSNMLNKENLSNYYEIPLKQRIEFLDARDAALALINATNNQIKKRIFLIGGGSNCQFLYEEFVAKLFSTLGIGELPDNLFKVPLSKDEWYTTDWLDTSDAQKSLNFQEHSFTDFLRDMKKEMKFLRFAILLLRPIVRTIMKRSSPYRK